MSVCLAYDGSVNGDWVARYAVRLAAGHPDRRLRILHVETAEFVTADLSEKLTNIRLIAEMAGVESKVEICAMRDGVVGGLVDHLKTDPDVLLVAGVRVQGGRRGFLAGTISWQLLRDTSFDVVAFRVVQPGALGVVRRLLMPVAGHKPGHQTAIAMLDLVAHDLQDLRLMHVVELPTQKLRRLQAPEAEALRHRAAAYLREIERNMRVDPLLAGVALETAVRISDDWARETIIDGAQQNADLICLEASRLSLERGFRYGDPFETLLRDASSDVAIYRGGAQNGG
ncbi:MAG: universal stress protein [Rhodospirillaceae bacterium]|jgi:nucleotide-binding universal stress UspA family protein|nr:universal stress protein [Rhodospirillaceae bacterium]